MKKAMTLDEMQVLNNTAMNIARLGVRPPGIESYNYARHLLDVLKGIQAEVKAKWPHLTGPAEQVAQHVITMQRLDVQTDVVNAAKAFVAELDEGRPLDDADPTKLIASVHVHNLVTEMPAVPANDATTDQEQDP